MLNTKQPKKIVPIFFATDDNYAPYLGVALESIKANSSKDYFYKIHILNTVLTTQNFDRLKKYGGELFS